MTKPTKIGIIGAGIWGNQHARVFKTMPEVELVAVCDLDEARARTMQTESGAAQAFTDHKKLFDLDIDAVSIATPDFTHTPLILDALKSGKHVLTEKPLATNVEEALQVKEEAEKSDRVVMIDFHNRVNPPIAAARDMIAAGDLGHMIHADARLSNTTFVPTQMLSWASRSSALWFLGSHLIDALRFMFNDDVIRVYAQDRRGHLQKRGIETADVHLAMLEFSKGAIVTIENSWVLSTDNPQIFDFSVRMVGSDGQINLDPSHNGAMSFMKGEGQKYQDLFGITPTGDTRIGGFVLESVARFIDSIRHGTPVVATVDDGVRVTKVLAAIEESTKTRLPIDITY